MAMFAKQYCGMQSASRLPKGSVPTPTTTFSLPALPINRMHGKQLTKATTRSGTYHCSLRKTTTPPDQPFNATAPKNTKEMNRLRASAIDESMQPLPLQGGGLEKTEITSPVLKWWNILNRFIRPYASLGTVVAVASVSLLPVTSVADLTPAFFLGFAQAFTAAMFISLYIITVNQLYDVQIDRINKPYLPLSSGEISVTAGALITAAFAAVSFMVAYMSGSSSLQAFTVLAFALGTAYSAKLPLLRWKNNPFLTLMSMMSWRGLLFHIPVFFHMQVHALKKQMQFTRPALFSTLMITFLWFVISLTKDIPDVDGDKANGIQTFALWFGQERLFKFCVRSLMVAYAVCMGVGAASTNVACRIVSVLGHAILAFVCWHSSKNTDLTDRTFLTKYYLLIWKLMYAEYFLIHFVR